MAIGILIAAKDASALTITTGNVSLKDLVVKSDYIVMGTVADKKVEVVTVGEGKLAGKRAYTIFTLSVEKVIKGDPDTKEVLIRVEGGRTRNFWQPPMGPYFSIPDKVLEKKTA